LPSSLAIISAAFAKATLIKTAPSPIAIAVGRVDGDSIDDLVITHAGNKDQRPCSEPHGISAPAAIFKTVGINDPWMLFIGDFNDDGKSDVATTNFYSRNVSFFQGDGLGGFTAATLFATGRRPTALAVADFNLDGILDLTVSNHLNNFVSILLSNGAAPGAAQFQPQLKVRAAGQTRATSIVAADFNGDGIADLALGKQPPHEYQPCSSALILERFRSHTSFDLGKSFGMSRRTVVSQSPTSTATACSTSSRPAAVAVDARVLLRKS
jgi:hypothetical protein